MRRERNRLYFQPREKARFLRAITLVGIGCGFSEERVRNTVEHERAHIERAEELGHAEGIDH